MLDKKNGTAKTGQNNRLKIIPVLRQVDDLSIESNAVSEIGQIRSNCLRTVLLNFVLVCLSYCLCLVCLSISELSDFLLVCSSFNNLFSYVSMSSFLLLSFLPLFVLSLFLPHLSLSCLSLSCLSLSGLSILFVSVLSIFILSISVLPISVLSFPVLSISVLTVSVFV